MVATGDLLCPELDPSYNAWILRKDNGFRCYLVEGARLTLCFVPPSLRHRFKEGAYAYCIAAHPTIGGIRFGIREGDRVVEAALHEFNGAMFKAEFVPPVLLLKLGAG